MTPTIQNDVIPIVVPVPSTLKSINFFLIKHDENLILIDAGLDNEECWAALNRALREMNVSLHDLTHILLSHHHADHVGLVNRIVSKHPVPVYAHPLAFPRLKRDPEFMKARIQFFARLYEEMGSGEAGRRQVEYLIAAIEKNRSLTLEGDLKSIPQHSFLGFDMIEIPGHAPDQVAFYDPLNKRLFSGDLLIEHISSNALVEPDPSGRRLASLSQHRQSMQKCLHLQAEHLFPGHGSVMGSADELIQKRLNGMEAKAERFLKLIQKGHKTGSDIAKACYKDVYEKQFSLVMSEVVGHLDYLESQGRVESILKSGVRIYSI
ncbi:MAG TPA: MBL fold metallo-hydrolase [Bacillaceae bacterium]